MIFLISAIMHLHLRSLNVTIKVYLPMTKVYLIEQTPDNRRSDPEVEAVKAW